MEEFGVLKCRGLGIRGFAVEVLGVGLSGLGFQGLEFKVQGLGYLAVRGYRVEEVLRNFMALRASIQRLKAGSFGVQCLGLGEFFGSSLSRWRSRASV